MLLKCLVFCVAFISSPILAHTLDFSAATRQANVNGVKWGGSEWGFSYRLDINEVLAAGPYLSTSIWDIRNSALHSKSEADHREFGPEIRFAAPMEDPDMTFEAGASYSLFSKGTAKTADGRTADITVEGFRFKVGVTVPFEAGFGITIMLIKGIQTVEIENDLGRAKENLDDLAMAAVLSF